MVNEQTANSIDEIARALGRNHNTSFERRMPGYGDRLRGQVQEQQPESSGMLGSFVIKLSLLGLFIAGALYLAALWWGHELSLAGHSDSTKVHQVTLGNDVISVSENMIRFRKQRRSGSLERLDLHLHWPSLQGFSQALLPSFNNEDRRDAIVFVAIEPRAMSADMSGRIEPIYAKFFAGEQQETVAGLVRQPLAPEAGFIEEDLYYEKNSPYPFSARCVREGAKIGARFCLRDIHLGKDLMVTYRFHARYLKDWMMLDQAIRNKVASMLM